MVSLITPDGEIISMDEEIANQSGLIRDLQDGFVDGDSKDTPIPISNIHPLVLKKVVEYLNQHRPSLHRAAPSESSWVAEYAPLWKEFWTWNRLNESWDREFFRVDDDMLFSLTLAANFLDIQDLLERCCEELNKKIEDKTPTEIRALYAIPDDYGLDPTPIPGNTAKAGGKLKRPRGKRSGKNYAESESEEEDEDKDDDESNDDEVDEIKEKPKSEPEPVLRRGTRSRPATKKR